jgi:hypothetical protein
MKKILFYLFVMSVVFTLIIFSCKKEKKYDWNAIEPGTQSITGPASITIPPSIIGNGKVEYEFSAIARGGSTYKWAAFTDTIKLTPDTIPVIRTSVDTPYVAFVRANVVKTARSYLQVTETTRGGKIGNPAYFTYNIAQFCNFETKERFVGNFKCVESNASIAIYNSTIFSNIPGYTYRGDSLLITNFNNKPLEVKIVFDRNNEQTVRIIKEEQIMMSYGIPYKIEVTGSGTYDYCRKRITISYKIFVNKQVQPWISGSVLYR